MLTVHHLRKSVSDRVLWLCEELGLRYELKCYDREASMAAPPEYKALSAFGTAPVIEDGDLTLHRDTQPPSRGMERHNASHAGACRKTYTFSVLENPMLPLG